MFRGDFSEIGETLVGLPFPAAWNGSLWTLRYEVSCYAVVGALLLIGYLRRQKLVLPLLFVFSTAFSLAVHASSTGGMAADLALLVPFFAAGATLFMYAERIRCGWPFAALSMVLLVVTFMTGTAESLAALPFAYLLMWAGISAPKGLRRIGSKNDYSYGTYLYAFPAQQLLVIFGAASLGLPVYVALSLIATAPFAFLSWHLVEKPATRLKDLWKPKAAPAGAGTTSRDSAAIPS
jgi:peptidoglycan/LPS O-acetylase OafA/YrhL